MLASSLLPVLLLLLAASPSSARRTHGKRASSSSHFISQSVDSRLTNTRRRMDLVVEAKRAVPVEAPLVRPRMDIVAERSRTAQPPAQMKKRQTVSKRCKVRPSAAALVATTTATSASVVASSSALVASSSVMVPNLAVQAVASSSALGSIAPTTTSAAAATTTAQTEAAATTTKAAEVVAEAGWPTITQAGAIPSATATSASDPYLLSASYALNNAGNSLFTQKRTKGELTYYAQGQTSCGSVYDDTSFTAAVSKELYDSWPGAGVATNRNPICGPFSPGRLSLTSEVLVASTTGSVLIGGDGLLNCVAAQMCHIPLTATLTYNGRSAQVQIVDRCEGCAVEDIDVTPAVFEYLTGNMALGRLTSGATDFTWSFDQY